MSVQIQKVLTVIAMFIAAGSVALPDTSPMSPRTIATASSSVILAIVVLLQALGISDALTLRDYLQKWLGELSLRQAIEVTIEKVFKELKRPAQTDQSASQPAQA